MQTNLSSLKRSFAASIGLTVAIAAFCLATTVTASAAPVTFLLAQASDPGTDAAPRHRGHGHRLLFIAIGVLVVAGVGAFVYSRRRKGGPTP